jgi:hypothetical protein
VAGLADIVTGLIGGVGDAALKIRQAITGIDPTKQAEIQELTMNIAAQANQAEIELVKAQAEIDKQEAANPNIFISGWRPAIGWLCGFAFGLNYIVYPLLNWGLAIAKISLNPALPQMDITTMLPILMGLLGLGTMRTVEKIQGAQGNH